MALSPSVRGLLAAREQALVDLASSRASEVVVVRHEKPSEGIELVAGLESLARRRGFAWAELPLFGDRGLDTLDAIVRFVLRDLSLDKAREKKGFLALLETYAERHKGRAGERLAAALAEEGAVGELSHFALAYLEAQGREAQRFGRWMAGEDAEGAPPHALAPRTAKRALVDLTRVLRALGASGLVVCITGGEVLPKLSDARRRDAYTVLRELIDNADGGRGMVSTALFLFGAPGLFEGHKSAASLQPLATRLAVVGEPPAPPHRPVIDLATAWPATSPAPRDPGESDADEVRALVRACQGLPEAHAIQSLTVGYDRIDAEISRLFSLSDAEGSVFTALVGAYGAGKTHFLLHLAARARAGKRPVFRLPLERLDVDLGNPQRHVARLLDTAELPLPGAPGVGDLLVSYRRSEKKKQALLAALQGIASVPGDAAEAARRALADEDPWSVLRGEDLAARPGPRGRELAYGLLLLWIELLGKLEKTGGPVLLIDEAENLYQQGYARQERRTALRSLAFYCGGALPRALVVLAVTAEAAGQIRAEADELCSEIADQRTVLPWEDAAMLSRRLRRSRPLLVPGLDRDHCEELAHRVRKLHARVRGKVVDPAFDDFAESIADGTPREVVRKTTDRLERLWFWGAG